MDAKHDSEPGSGPGPGQQIEAAAAAADAVPVASDFRSAKQRASILTTMSTEDYIQLTQLETGIAIALMRVVDTGIAAHQRGKQDIFDFTAEQLEK
jgi:hypothetical protein